MAASMARNASPTSCGRRSAARSWALLGNHPGRRGQSPQSRARGLGAPGNGPSRSNNGVNPLGQYAHISRPQCVEPAPAESSAGDDCRPRCERQRLVGSWRGAGCPRSCRGRKEEIAAAFAVPPRSVVFTSGGTEANALALRGIAADRIIISAVEHPSIHAAAGQSGRLIEHLPVDGCGIVALTAPRALAVERTRKHLGLADARQQRDRRDPAGGRGRAPGACARRNRPLRCRSGSRAGRGRLACARRRSHDALGPQIRWSAGHRRIARQARHTAGAADRRGRNSICGEEPKTSRRFAVWPRR